MSTSLLTVLMLSSTSLLLLAIFFHVPTFVFKAQGNLLWVLLIYLINSVIAFILYAYDKSVAGKGKMRVPEVLLHFSEVLGGWPGAMIARPVLHHKTNWQNKFAFKIVNWLIILVHLGFWAWWYFLNR